MWYVYFLELRNGDMYVGSTDDLKRRFGSHSRGEVNSTKVYLPVILKSYIAVPTEIHARQLEVYFKSGSGRRSPRSACSVSAMQSQIRLTFFAFGDRLSRR